MNMKLSIAVCIVVVACSLAAENRKIDESQLYKNHRISASNDTLNHAAHKYPVYPSQVYANLSNGNDIATVGWEQPRTTVVAAGAEGPSDVVRVFVTAAPNKRISNKPEHAAAATASVAQSPSNYYYKTSSSAPPPSVHLVTSKVYATTVSSTNNNINNRRDVVQPISPVYSSPVLTASFRAADEELTRRKSFNGTTKTKHTMKTQGQVQSNAFYAATTTTTTAMQPKNVQNNPQRNATSFVGSGGIKLANSSNASKPFTTVLVPKQMLNGADYVQRDENSFRPIAAPAQFSYKVPQASSPLDTNSIENRRAAFVQKQANIQLVAATAASIPKESKHHAYVKPSAVHTIQEYGSAEERSPVVSDRNNYNLNNNNNKRDRTEVQQTYSAPVDIEKQSIKRDPPKYDKPQQHDVKYGSAVSESFKYNKQPSVISSVSSDKQQQQFREYYPATTEAQTYKGLIKPYLPYNSAGKSESSSGPSKVFSSSPTTRFKQQLSAANSVKESSGPVEFSMDDAKTKDVLKSLLHDLIKSKQQSEIKTFKPFKSAANQFHEYYPELTADASSSEVVLDDASGKDKLYESLLRDMLKSKQQGENMPKTSMGEIIDAYFKTNRPNVDLSVDSYDIDTGMSCNLRSSRYISDGQCVTTKPVVEAVCADRCLVYSTAPAQYSSRQRSSSLLAAAPQQQVEQVEALHCVDGDSKFVRVQLKCRDGNTLNNVIKVVTNCQCKLHQIQPQMRTNTPKMDQIMSPEIMSIVNGKF